MKVIERKHRSRSAALMLWWSVSMGVSAEPLLLLNVHLVDIDTTSVTHGSLLMDEGLIVARDPVIPTDYSGTTIDLAGKWVMPGLVDLHVHVTADQAPGGVFEPLDPLVTTQRYLYAGVTAVLDLFGDEETLVRARDRQRAGSGEGSDLHASLSCLTATDGHCTEYGTPTRTIDTPQQAMDAVHALAARGADVIKIVYSIHPSMPTIDKATLAAAVNAAREAGLKTVVHIDSVQDVRDVVDAGADAITHLPDLDPMPMELAERMAQRGIAAIPTLAVHTEVIDLVQTPALLEAPLAVALSSEGLRAAYDREYGEERIERMYRFNQMYLDSVATLHDAGVTILAGTDAGNPGTIHGYSLHRELIRLVQAGLTTWEALEAGSTGAATFLGRRYGLREGDEASLLVLDASPVDDIANTQAIHGVIHHGRVVDRESLLQPMIEP